MRIDKKRLVQVGNVLGGIFMGTPTAYLLYQAIPDPIARWVMAIMGFIGMAWLVIAKGPGTDE